MKLTKIILLSIVTASSLLLAQNNNETCKQRLPQEVNSYQPSILPVLTIDGKTLFFDRKLHPENIGGTKDLDDIWYSDKDEHNYFQTAHNLGKDFNTSDIDLVFSITPDGKALIYGTKNGNPNGFSIAELYGNKFVNYRQLTIDDYHNKAKNFFAYLSADTRVLLFAIEGNNSIGSLDLYVSFKKNDNYEYTKPKNLGKTINTKLTEGSPFLAYDNKTLYFSSNGHQGFGGKDLFMTKRLDDTWTKWSKPINLGNKINTPKDDNSITLTALSDSAIISSWDTTTKREGLYYVCLPPSLTPEPYLIVTGKINGKNIKLTNFKNVDIQVKYDANNRIDHYKPLYGNRFYFLLRKDLFAPITITKPGFDDFGFSVNSNNLKKSKFVYYNTSLTKKRPKLLLLGTIYFDYDSYELNENALLQIQNIMDKIIELNEIQLVVKGHTDEKGSEAYNMILSQKRAEAVKSALTKLKIPTYLIKTEAKGESEPASESDEKNRRVEVYLIDN